MPSGAASSARTVGGFGLAVSKYSLHRDEAVDAVCRLASDVVQRDRAAVTGAVPTRPNLCKQFGVLSSTPFNGTLAAHVSDGLVSRPSRAAGTKYDAVSRAYARSVHSALTKQQTVSASVAQFQTELQQIMDKATG
jgi:trehalose/maltose transport system substrate-binding protein